MSESQAPAVESSTRADHARRALAEVRAHLKRRAVELAGLLLVVHASPVPAFPIVIMAYIIGALGGSLPLPAAAGVIGGMAGMLILYGVASHAALAAVLLHQAISLLVPLIGGAIAYAILRRRFGPLRPGVPAAPEVGQAE